MPSLHLVIGCFADVVQETATAGKLSIQPEFIRHQPAEMSHLEAMLQYVLTVTGSELEPAEKLNKLVVDVADVGGGNGLTADFHDVLVHLRLGFADDLLDSRGMNAAVLNQLCQSE